MDSYFTKKIEIKTVNGSSMFELEKDDFLEFPRIGESFFYKESVYLIKGISHLVGGNVVFFVVEK